MPQRYVVGIMGMLAMANAYTMRVCLNMAITQMVNHTKSDTENVDPNACPSDEVGKDISGNASAVVIHKPVSISYILLFQIKSDAKLSQNHFLQKSHFNPIKFIDLEDIHSFFPNKPLDGAACHCSIFNFVAGVMISKWPFL